MKHKIIKMILTLLILVNIVLIFQVIPMPMWLYIVLLIWVIIAAITIFAYYEDTIGREAQGEAKEESLEVEQRCTMSTCDKTIICYNGHIIPSNKVYIKMPNEFDGVHYNTYNRIDTVYNN